ncbi:hypothetical protein C8R43DRAFT_1134922 [Mycena crocata]|nr:hypothetical protein C8R43DRAFT_1134922 [Mycena crocata]
MHISTTCKVVDDFLKARHKAPPRYGPCAQIGPRSSKRRHTHSRATSDRAAAKVEHALNHVWAESTIEKYSNSLQAFWRFCDEENVTLAQRLPANEELLCSFAASWVGEIAGVTARGAISAVKAWHIVNDAPWLGGLRLRYVLRGIENLATASSKKDPRPPVTAEMLEVLEAELNHNDPKDAAVFAAACCTFWGQLRLGEFLSENQGSYLEGRIPLGSDLGRASTRAGLRTLRLPWTKTKGARGDTAMLCRQHGPSDPIRAVENHLSVNSILPDLPLFAYRNGSRELQCLSKKQFVKRCNEIWNKSGFPGRTGHCFRIGGTTELLLAGVELAVVQEMGRWQSDAFMIYWRRLDLLAPLHAEYIKIAMRLVVWGVPIARGGDAPVARRWVVPNRTCLHQTEQPA